MLQAAGVVVLLIGAVTCGPPVSRSRQDIEAFTAFLEKGRQDNGVLLSTRMAANPRASPWENSGKFEGDILLSEEEIQGMVENYASGRNAYTFPGTRWPGNVVVYDFEPGQFGSQQQRAILDAMALIERESCVRFRRRNSNEKDFVKITGYTNGCYANIGYMNNRGVHILNLARDNPGHGCLTPTTIIHEWLHILGFVHMQSTYNRDNFVRINWQNIQPGMEHNFDKYTSDWISNLGLPYEYTSCMHYGGYGFSINGRPTIEALHAHEGVMGQQSYVSELDWLRLRRHYQCPGAWNREEESQVAHMNKQ